ncbi:MAG: cell envelope biogenesis protein OmpA [Holophagae bacterium]|nr:MAG: cell envelope biogenesis protein OmpA [Holophagae bacterium]
MRRFSLSAALTAALALLAVPAVASDNGFYLGASVGQAEIKIEDLAEDAGTVDFSATDTAYKVFAGFRFLTFLGVEGSYVDLGAPQEDVDGGTLEADVTGYDAFAVGFLPLGIADVFAKVGMMSWDGKVNVDLEDLSGSFSDSGTDPAYGLGFQLRFKSFAARAEVEYFDIAGADNVYMYSIGGSYTF